MAASIKSLGSNKYQITVSNGHKPDGSRNRIYETITAKSPAAAQKAANLLDAEIKKGNYQAPSKLSFSEYVESWKMSAERNLALKTYHRYNELLRIHILPTIGGYKVDTLNPLVLEKLYNDLRQPQKHETVLRDGKKKVKEYSLSEQTIKHIHRLIGTILQTAFRKGIIKENPILRTDAPKVKKTELNCYDEKQIDNLVEALEESENMQFKVCVHIALSGGLRLGELCGLEFQDVDFDNNTITVCRSSQYIPGKGTIIKNPKNETSKRTIGIPEYVMDLIKDLQHEKKVRQVELGNIWVESNRLFTAADGSRIHPVTPSKWFHNFLIEKKLPMIRFHDLRHTSASYLIASGMDVITASKRFGHAKPSTTLNIYGHAFRKKDEEATLRMSAIYSKKVKKIETLKGS